MWRQRTLASQILLGVLAILVVTMSVGVALVVSNSRHTMDRQYEQRALAVANAVGQIPEIRAALVSGDPNHVIRRLAADVARATGAAYVVVADRTGTRYSHPNPALIGQRLEEGVVVLDGHGHVGIDKGSLGRSANGKAPVRATDGRIIGEVSVGILEKEVGTQLRHEIGVIALYLGLALGIGVLASWVLSRLIKRATFGLELSEISSLLQEREAMLHGIREGVIGFDARGRINVINNEACRLLNVSASATGRQLDEVLPPGRLRDLLTGAATGTDQVALTDEFLLVVNRMPVVLGGRDAGSVVTLRDRTELEALVRELNAVTGLTNALRAQEHEFTNRLHVMSGLLELGAYDEAAGYLDEISTGSITAGEALRARVAPQVVAALLLAKVSIAVEQGVEFVVSDESHLDATAAEAQMVLTVLGNLVDNAFEALAGQPEPRRVTVQLSDEDGLRIVVSDTGPGVPADVVDEIFRDGYSTKSPRADVRRGLGLALVYRLVHRAGGTITVTHGPRARFEVRLPRATGAARDAARGAARTPADAASSAVNR
jgi:two-component system CitB family sensor kinase